MTPRVESLKPRPLRLRRMVLARIEAMGNQLPPRLKAVLNLSITVVLAFVGLPLVALGVSGGDWAQASLGLGLAMLAVFNLFT